MQRDAFGRALTLFAGVLEQDKPDPALLFARLARLACREVLRMVRWMGCF